MYDRRINDKIYTFGNQGALFKNAMTWWDHETKSIWSQVWGQALTGPLKDTVLKPIPAEVVPWSTWREEHPATLVLRQEERYLLVGSRFTVDHVIGVRLGNSAKAYPYLIASQVRVINDMVGPYPVLIYVNAAKKSVQTYLRTVKGRVLTFEARAKGLVDRESGSAWDPVRGLVIAGPLRGETLRRLPHLTAYEYAWRDFYPQSQWYRP